MNYKIENGKIFVKILYQDREVPRAIQGAFYNRNLGMWEVPMSMENLEYLKRKLDGERLIPKEIIQPDKLIYDYVSPIKPFEHQTKYTKIMIEQKRWALLHEMGTGKTKTVIDTFSFLRSKGIVRGLLVIAPLTVIKTSWAEQLAEHGYTQNDVNFLIGTRLNRKRLIDEDKINLLNYEGVLSLGKELNKLNSPDIMIVLDESSKIKNPKAKRTKSILSIFTKNEYRYILSGTPITQSPIDIFSQYQFLDKRFLLCDNWYAFRNTYCNTMRHPHLGFVMILSYKNLDKLKALILKHGSILKKDDMECKLPPKIYEILSLDMPEELKIQYEQMKKHLLLEIESSGETVTAHIIVVKLLRLHQILSGKFLTDDKNNIKLNELIDVVQDNIENKIIVWCRFVESIKLIEKRLNSLGIGNVTFYGDTINREEQIQKFNNDNNIKVFIGQIATGGLGINLQVANTVVYYENTFSLQDRLQSEDRCHRIGQDKKVLYIDLVYDKTIDSDILTAIKKKDDIAKYLISNTFVDLDCSKIFETKTTFDKLEEERAKRNEEISEECQIFDNDLI